MGITAALWVATAVAGASAVNANETGRKARNTAKDQAEASRKQMADIQAEGEVGIPTANDQDAMRTRRRSIASMQKRKGRQSTILTGDAATGLGG